MTVFHTIGIDNIPMEPQQLPYIYTLTFFHRDSETNETGTVIHINDW
jgi:hypothetical protein